MVFVLNSFGYGFVFCFPSFLLTDSVSIPIDFGLVSYFLRFVSDRVFYCCKWQLLIPYVVTNVLLLNMPYVLLQFLSPYRYVCILFSSLFVKTLITFVLVLVVVARFFLFFCCCCLLCF